MRFLAALGVVAFHYTSRDYPEWGSPAAKVFPGLQNVTIYGALGVYLFFLISGFVILMTAWDRPLGGFVASRGARLFPAYWFAVIVLGTLLFIDRTLPGGNQWPVFGTPGFLVNLTMTQTAWGIPNLDGVYWTLLVELLFYLLIAIVVLWGITRNRILLVCALWPVLAILAQHTNQAFLVAILQPQYAPFFAMGMLVYLLYREGPSLVPIVLLVGNWAFAMHLAATSINHWLGEHSAGSSSPFVVMALITLFVGLLLVVALTPASRVSWKWLTVVGALTYPLYLLHQRIGYLLISVLARAWSPWLTLVVVIAVMCAVGYLVHRFVERPLGRRMRAAIESSLSRGRQTRPETQRDAHYR